MDLLQYYLTRYIGFFYYSYTWKTQIFNELIKFYPAEIILYINKNKTFIHLKDHTQIFFINFYTDDGHFPRFDDIYIEEDMDKMIINDMILPMYSQLKKEHIYVVNKNLELKNLKKF